MRHAERAGASPAAGTAAEHIHRHDFIRAQILELTHGHTFEYRRRPPSRLSPSSTGLNTAGIHAEAITASATLPSEKVTTDCVIMSTAAQAEGNFQLIKRHVPEIFSEYFTHFSGIEQSARPHRDIDEIERF